MSAYIQPVKQINTQADMEVWRTSEAYQRIWGYVIALANAVTNMPISHQCKVTKPVQLIIDLLNTMYSWVDDIPPLTEGQRFGNAAFRDWIKRLEENGPSLLQPLLSPEQSDANIELSTYLKLGFGHGQRLDYGSGHELSFFALLTCLRQLEILQIVDDAAVVLRIIPAYLRVVRRLQLTYRLEPAGSHGVWGLDDYQFLPYLWGSAQLVGNTSLIPSDVMDKEKLRIHAPEYLYFDCIQFIYQVKKGPFREHSPLLSDISRIPGWPKVYKGLGKMYQAEVLCKFPVVQHLLFGSLLPFIPAE